MSRGKSFWIETNPLRYRSTHPQFTDLPYMETKPKLIFFTDFDGTITVDDSM